MEKYAWRATVKVGCIEEYKRRHNEIWPEMVEVLKNAGIKNYTIWNIGNELFGYYECEKGVRFAADYQKNSVVVEKWNKYMKDVSITIPNSVTSIEEYAFSGCTSLKKVYYAGTEQDRSKMSIDSGNTYLTNANWHYSLHSSICGDNVAWNLYNDGTLYINGTGNMYDYGYSVDCSDYSVIDNYNSPPWNNYADMIRNVIVSEGVTSIGNNDYFDYFGDSTPDLESTFPLPIFSNIKQLESMVLPNSISHIGFLGLHSSNVKIYYSGNINNANAIQVDNFNHENDIFLKADWHYNCTEKKIEKYETLRNTYLKTAIQKKSTATVSDSVYDLRLVSMLDCLNDYKEVGFYITIAGYNDGENDQPIKYSTDTVYTSFLNGENKVNASDYGASYFTLVSMQVPSEYYSSNIKIQPYITFTDGTEFLGNAVNTTVSHYIK